MSNSSLYRNGEPDPDDGNRDREQSDAEDLVFLSPAQDRADQGGGEDDDERHAVPALLDDEDDDGGDYTGGRAMLDLDADAGSEASAGREPVDLSTLIGQLGAGGKKRRRLPQETQAPSQSATGDQEEIARLRSELEAERNNVRRAQADLINYRRKADQDRERSIQDASERVIKQLFPILDDFERGLGSTQQSQSYEQLSSGVQAIMRNIDSLLMRYGVEPVESVGKMFDPTLHEAVAIVETEDQPEDMIIEELRKGYLLDGRLLRAAMVKVARHAPAAPAAAENEAGAEQPSVEQGA